MIAKSTKKVAEPRLHRKALLAVLDDRKTITSFIQRRPYTMVALKSWYNDKEYDGVGFSKVCFPDGWDGEQGGDIAKSRALMAGTVIGSVVMTSATRVCSRSA